MATHAPASDESSQRIASHVLRRMVMAADERAATADERENVAKAYGRIEAYETGGMHSGDYHSAATLVMLLAPVAARVAVVAPRVTIVRGSTPGATYRLERFGAAFRCSCPGFTHRGKCKHAKAAQCAAQRQNEGEPT